MSNHVENGIRDRSNALDARVLLVEDNEDCRLYITHVLERAGCEVACASNGEDGIRRGAHGGFDVILADISMPRVDGFQLTGSLRTTWEAQGLVPIPIVALTGHATFGFRERCLNAGMVEYVTKPIPPKALTDVVRRWSRREGYRVEVPADLADLIPDYLARRHSDLARIRGALTRGDFQTVRSLGHDMKGSGTPYGFSVITDIGGRLEDAASRRDAEKAQTAARDLDDYLQTLVWSVAQDR